MPAGVVALMVVSAFFTVLQLQHAVVRAGGLSARQSAVYRLQLSDQWNHYELVVPDLTTLTKSDRLMINYAKRRRYRYVSYPTVN